LHLLAMNTVIVDSEYARHCVFAVGFHGSVCNL
jgi:hypothetical protein